MDSQENIWPKHISVDKRIVRILSASTYDNFPNALKEIITNSYDADASLVNISIDLKREVITIEDDGIGMSESDFSLYLRIAGMKRTKRTKTASGRNVIGQFGVGFLSVFPFFKNYALESKISNSNEILHAEIPCHLYFESNSVDIDKIGVQGGIKYDRSKSSKQYTKITLSGFTNLTKAFFYPTKNTKVRKNSILNDPPIKVLKWRLSEELPIQYADKQLNKIFNKYSANLPFHVKFNGDEMTRPTYGSQILEIHKKDFETIGNIKFRYFICTSNEAINNPIEGRYLKIRNLNVGVGDRTAFGLGTEVGGARSRLHWLSGEVHIIEGLNDIITVSRDKFNYDPDYETLKDFFIKRLSFHSTQLENVNELEKFISSAKENKIKNVKLLEPKTLHNKLKTLEKGIEEKKYISSVTKEPTQHFQPEPKFDVDSFKKIIEVNGKQFVLASDTWDFRTDFFGACKIDKKKVTINQSYPLFKSPKYSDIFIKLHIMLVDEFNKGLLTKRIFSDLSRDILNTYKDYIK